MEIEFFEPMRIPSATHQEKKVGIRNGKPFFYEPQNVKDARAKYMAYLGKHVPKHPLKGVIRLKVAFEYHEELLKLQEKDMIWWKTTKPDTDNMIKLVKDCMTKLGYWEDDAQVCDECVQKFCHKYDEGIYVKVVAPMFQGWETPEESHGWEEFEE